MKKLAVGLFTLVFALAFIPAVASASPTVKMTVYDSVVKSGNTVYCSTQGDGICKVTLKNGKVKSKKWLVKPRKATMGALNGSMKKKGKYLYYIAYTDGTVTAFNRVNVFTGKNQLLADNVIAYAFKNKRIYVTFRDPDTDKITKRVTTLNCKTKKKTSTKAKMAFKESNAKGYSIVDKQKGKYIKTYLKTPKGKFFLCKTIDDSYLIW